MRDAAHSRTRPTYLSAFQAILHVKELDDPKIVSSLGPFADMLAHWTVRRSMRRGRPKHYEIWEYC